MTLNSGQLREVTDFAPLVKRLAYQLISRLPANVEVDDLIQAGMMGLLDAMRNFDDTQGAQFETYATQRVRGAMLDELRELDWAPRAVRKQARDLEQATRRLEQKLGQAPSEQQIADELSVTLEQYQAMLLDARGLQLMYYEDFEHDDGEHSDFDIVDTQPTPLQALLDGSLKSGLVAAIGELPEREKILMALHYQEEMNLKEIGAVLGVSESRVCQMHTQAVLRLRTKMRNWVA